MDNVPMEQESLKGGVGELQFNFMFNIFGCTWQYDKTIFQGGNGQFQAEMQHSLEMWDLEGLKKLLPDPKG